MHCNSVRKCVGTRVQAYDPDITVMVDWALFYIFIYLYNLTDLVIASVLLK